MSGNLVVGSSITAANLPLGTGTSVVYINGSGAMNKGVLGPYDNYQYWTLNTGTSSVNILSTSQVSFVGGTVFPSP